MYMFIFSFREKDILWKRNDHLYHLQKVKIDDRWINDSEVSCCLACKKIFSFILRKVVFQYLLLLLLCFKMHMLSNQNINIILYIIFYHLATILKELDSFSILTF